MKFLGEALSDQADATPFTPRRTKDRIEELPLARNRELFSELELVFFDTTSIYFEGGGVHFGRRGFSEDHRPDLFQMVVGAVLDGNGRPIADPPASKKKRGTPVSAPRKQGFLKAVRAPWRGPKNHQNFPQAQGCRLRQWGEGPRFSRVPARVVRPGRVRPGVFR
jgi:hypothetical protein